MRYPLFISGGSAIANLARYFTHCAIPSAHIVTTFDNGGSTAELRKVFAMPAVGDLRNRILSLASPATPYAIIRLLKLRLSSRDTPENLQMQLEKIARPANGNWKKMPAEAQRTLRQALECFIEKKPDDFNLANASIGNLVITGFYLREKRDLQTALQTLAQLLEICGFVEPITLAHLQLGAILENNACFIGQDKFKNLSFPIKKIFLTVHEAHTRHTPSPCHAPISERAKTLIESAGIICYSPGSFYSSLLANLLLRGVGETIAATRCPKIFIPSSGGDPEAKNLGVYDQVRIILETLRQDKAANIENFINFILIDSTNGVYPGNLAADAKNLRDLGIKVLDLPVIAQGKSATHLPEPTARTILELAGIDLAKTSRQTKEAEASECHAKK